MYIVHALHSSYTFLIDKSLLFICFIIFSLHIRSVYLLVPFITLLDIHCAVNQACMFMYVKNK